MKKLYLLKERSQKTSINFSAINAKKKLRWELLQAIKKLGYKREDDY